MVNITAIIHTKNEERNVLRAIQSLKGFASEILVIDMCSEDNTVSIAIEAGANVVEVENFGFVEPARRIALQHASHDWIYLCDADEVLTPGLSQKLIQISEEDAADLVNIPFRTFMFGKEIAGAGWSRKREYHFRFFKKACVEYSDKIHTDVGFLPNSRVISLPPKDEFCVIHFNYSNFEHFIEKMNRYTTIEANTKDVPSSSRLLFRILRETWQRLVTEKAWRDGYRGLSLVFLMITYRVLSYSKARLREEFMDKEDIYRFYDSVFEEEFFPRK